MVAPSKVVRTERASTWITFPSPTYKGRVLDKGSSRIRPSLRSWHHVEEAIVVVILGNIPNIIGAGKLKIRSGERAGFGLPLGLGIMALYSGIMLIIRY